MYKVFNKLFSKNVLLDIGFFANIVDCGGVKIAISTDNVGTKTLIAAEAGEYWQVGYDCVANNVNDILCVGAMPVAMVNYIIEDVHNDFVVSKIFEGMVEACRVAGIDMVGGETALSPDILHDDNKKLNYHSKFDLSGTCIGIVSRDLVDGRTIEPGDVVLGFSSSGLHSNGFTLVRDVFFKNGYVLESPLEKIGEWQIGSLAHNLLVPTKIYVDVIRELKNFNIVLKGLANITGGGLSNLLRLKTPHSFYLDNLPSISSAGSCMEIFDKLMEVGNLTYCEMYSTFNMGIGFCVIISEEDFVKIGVRNDMYKIGTVVDLPENSRSVCIKFEEKNRGDIIELISLGNGFEHFPRR